MGQTERVLGTREVRGVRIKLLTEDFLLVVSLPVFTRLVFPWLIFPEGRRDGDPADLDFGP